MTLHKNKRSPQAILPPKTIGIIGGGQLGRMMAIAAKYMGYNVIVLDPTENCPTVQVADDQIIAPYDDMKAIKKLTENCDVITYEFENVDLKAATYIESAGKLPQGALALEITQNREAEKTLMRDAGIPVADFTIVRNEAECRAALQHVTYPVVIKTCHGGYDGKGQLKLDSDEQIEEAIQFVQQDGPFIIENWLSFDKEISVVFTRSHDGKMTYFPLAENIHKDHILYETIAPARVSDEVKEKALQAAKVLAERVNVVGTFAIEMFVQGEDIYINEMAPRPHNSGHYTIESCNVSQFTQHIRAICHLPLIPIEQLQEAVMINVLGENMERALQAMQTMPNSFVHLYGKDVAQPKRKMGHVTFIGQSLADIDPHVKRYEQLLTNDT